jgi:hypothetical protein
MDTWPARNDRIFVETRIVAGGVILVLLLAVLVLYLFPQYTDQNFAWTIVPPTTALLMGAGYFAGAYFFLRVMTEKKWHRVHAGFLPITAFTIFMLGATLLHWDRFHQDAWQFYLWTVIYIATPLLVPLLWWRNHATDPGTLEENDLRFPARVRSALIILGLLGGAVMVLSFILPAIPISLAPWKLTELTTRVGAGWGMLTSMTTVSIAYDGRWSAARILVESGTIGPALMLLAVPRAAGDFDWSNPTAWAFVGALGAALIFLVGVHLWLDRQSKVVREVV